MDEQVVARRAVEFGFARWTTDWHEVLQVLKWILWISRTPNHLHAEIAIAAAGAGKHIYCEKPLANTSADGARIVAAVEKAGVTSIVGFNYLKNPAQAFARQLIQAGELGEITLFRGTFDQDFLATRMFLLVGAWIRAWLVPALGDLGSHTIGFAHFLVGDIIEVWA